MLLRNRGIAECIICVVQDVRGIVEGLESGQSGLAEARQTLQLADFKHIEEVGQHRGLTGRILRIPNISHCKLILTFHQKQH